MIKTTQTLSKTLAILVMLFSLTFSINSYAGGDSKRRPKITHPHAPRHTHVHSKSCGHMTTSVPLDGGLGILLLGAGIFGVRKLRENKK